MGTANTRRDSSTRRSCMEQLTSPHISGLGTERSVVSTGDTGHWHYSLGGVVLHDHHPQRDARQDHQVSQHEQDLRRRGFLQENVMMIQSS